MRRRVVLVGILARRFGAGDLDAVPNDAIACADQTAVAAVIAGIDGDAVSPQVLPYVLAVKGEGIVVVDEQRIPLRRLLMPHQMRYGRAVLVVDEVEAEGGRQREFRHFRLVQHAAAAVLDAVAVFRRAEVGEEVQLAFGAGFGRGVARLPPALTDFLHLPLRLLILHAGDEDDRDDHDAHDERVQADAAAAVDDRRVIGIVPDGHGLPHRVGRAVGIERAGVACAVDVVFRRDGVRRVLVFKRAFILLDGDDGRRGLLKAPGLEKRDVRADQYGDYAHRQRKEFEWYSPY